MTNKQRKIMKQIMFCCNLKKKLNAQIYWELVLCICAITLNL